MRFVKCNIMQVTRKRTNEIEISYTLEGTVPEMVVLQEEIETVQNRIAMFVTSNYTTLKLGV